MYCGKATKFNVADGGELCALIIALIDNHFPENSAPNLSTVEFVDRVDKVDVI